MQELETKLRNDLSKVGLEVNYTLSLRPYSKSYFGRYDTVTGTIILYVYQTPNGVMYPYEELLLTLIHEAIHCKQWNDPNYVRIKGVMHDPEFKRLYNLYSNRAKARMLLKEVRKYDSICKKGYNQSYDLCSGVH